MKGDAIMNENLVAGEKNTEHSAEAEVLLKRAFLVIEDGDWEKAKGLLEMVLNIDPENAKAYVGKVMAEKQIKTVEEIGQSNINLSKSNDFKNALRFADDKYRAYLESLQNQAEDNRHENKINKLKAELEACKNQLKNNQKNLNMGKYGLIIGGHFTFFCLVLHTVLNTLHIIQNPGEYFNSIPLILSPIGAFIAAWGLLMYGIGKLGDKRFSGILNEIEARLEKLTAESGEKDKGDVHEVAATVLESNEAERAEVAENE